MVGLPEVEKNFEDMYNRLHTIPACDRRTDILPRHSPRCAYASRGKNLIVRIGNSEAEVTNNKRLYARGMVLLKLTTDRHARSIARPLCDSRASCTSGISRSRPTATVVFECVHDRIHVDWIMGGATGGVGGQCLPLLGPGGYRGYRGGPMKMMLASTADSLCSVLYKWLNFNSPDSSRHLPSYW